MNLQSKSLQLQMQLQQMQQLQQIEQSQQMQQFQQIEQIDELTQTEQIDETIFFNNETTSDRIAYLGSDKINELNTGISISSDKKYFQRLNALDIDLRVKNLVMEKLSSINERFHVISDEVLCGHVICSYRELNLEFDYYDIYSKFGLKLRGKKVSTIISNTSTSRSCTVEMDRSLNIILISPSQYIEPLFREYISNNSISLSENEIQYYITCFKNFTLYMCNKNRILIDKQPCDVASVCIFILMRDFIDHNFGRDKFSQEIFSKLHNVSNGFRKTYKFINECCLKNIKPKTLEELVEFRAKILNV